MEGARVWVAGRGAGEGVASREPRQVEGTGLLEEKGSTRSAPGRVGSRFGFSRARLVPAVRWAGSLEAEKKKSAPNLLY